MCVDRSGDLIAGVGSVLKKLVMWLVATDDSCLKVVFGKFNEAASKVDVSLNRFKGAFVCGLSEQIIKIHRIDSRLAAFLAS